MAPQIPPDVQSYLALSIPGRAALSANEDAQYKTTPGTGVTVARGSMRILLAIRPVPASNFINKVL